MHPKRDFSFFDVNVSSPYVCQELVKRNRQKRSKALWERIEDGRITAIGFALFEEAFHEFMQARNSSRSNSAPDPSLQMEHKMTQQLNSQVGLREC